MSLLKDWCSSNDRVKKEESEVELFNSYQYELQIDSINGVCYICLFVFYASKISCERVPKINGSVRLLICLRLTMI